MLTANIEVLHHSMVGNLAARVNVTPAQIVFRFARGVGILPLTGTSNPEHMRQDLASTEIELSAEAVRTIEAVAG